MAAATAALAEAAAAAAAAAAPLCCMDCLRWSMASCGDIGGNGTPRFGGRPGLELNSENKLFFIRPGGRLVRREGRERGKEGLQRHLETR